MDEFRSRGYHNAGTVATEADMHPWPLVNGLWALFVGFGLVLSAIAVNRARTWQVLTSPLRSFLADYGVVCLVIVWTGISFAVDIAPDEVPRRVDTPNTWEVRETWLVARQMSEVPGR